MPFFAGSTHISVYEVYENFALMTQRKTAFSHWYVWPVTTNQHSASSRCSLLLCWEAFWCIVGIWSSFSHHISCFCIPLQGISIHALTSACPLKACSPTGWELPNSILGWQRGDRRWTCFWCPERQETEGQLFPSVVWMRDVFLHGHILPSALLQLVNYLNCIKPDPQLV